MRSKHPPKEGGGGGGCQTGRDGDARRKLLNKPLKETDLGVAQPIEAILNFDYLNRVNKTNWKYMIFYIS